MGSKGRKETEDRMVAAEERQMEDSQLELRHNVAAMETVSDAVAQAGGEHIEAGAQRLDDASEAAAAGQALGAMGVSDVTRGQEYLFASERAALLSQVVAQAGVQDLGQGASMLAASDDLDVISAIVAGISADDLEDAMDLAAIAGQLSVTGDVVAGLDMPVLAAFLDDRGSWLREIAVDTVLRFGAGRALSDALAETGLDIEALGTGEVSEGLTRMAASGMMAVHSDQVGETGAELVAEGLVEMAAADAMAEASEELAAEGVAEVAEGAYDLGESEALHATAAFLDTVVDAPADRPVEEEE